MRWLGVAGIGVLVAITVESFNVLPQRKRLGEFQAAARSTYAPLGPSSSIQHRSCCYDGCCNVHHALTSSRKRAGKRPRYTTLSASIADQSSSTADGHNAIAYVDDIAPLERIDVSGLSPSQVSEAVDFSRPCILAGALELPECEAWCDALLQDLGEETCAFQIRENETGRSEVFEASLMEFVQGLQEESTHEDSW